MLNDLPTGQQVFLVTGYTDLRRSIYHEESLLKELSAEERYKEHLAKIKPLLDELFAWLETVTVSGKGKLTDAVHYALHEKPNLYTFLENGDVPLDNNRAENKSIACPHRNMSKRHFLTPKASIYNLYYYTTFPKLFQALPDILSISSIAFGENYKTERSNHNESHL